MMSKSNSQYYESDLNFFAESIVILNFVLNRSLNLIEFTYNMYDKTIVKNVFM